MKIKDLVKNKRLQLKENQKEFGMRFRVSHAAISDLESGKTKSINEDLLNFVFSNNCEHKKREYKTISKCILCGFEQEENFK